MLLRVVIIFLVLVGNIELNSAWMGGDQPTGEIIFVSDRDGNYEIYVMNADGSNPRNLTNNTAFDANADWSPDGERIAFISDRDSTQTGQSLSLYLMDADGSNIDRMLDEDLTIFPEFYLATGNPFSWSPDGQKIALSATAACVECESEPRIYIIDVETREAEQLSFRAGLSPVWSFDGLFIGFASSFSQARLWGFGIVQANGGFEVYIENINGETVPIYQTFSAEYDINIDEQCVQDPFDRSYIVELLDITDPNNFLSLDSHFVFRQEQNLAHISVESQETGDIYPPTEMVNGNWNLFSSDQDGDWEIYIQNAVTNEMVQLTDNDALDGPASWRPQTVSDED